jgi:hypothetical protein
MKITQHRTILSEIRDTCGYTVGDGKREREVKNKKNKFMNKKKLVKNNLSLGIKI